CLSVSSRLVQPSPVNRRVGIHIFTFEACSSFTRVTACRIACPPKSGLLSRGFDPTSCPTGPLSSFHVYRQLHGWIPPPQVIFAVSAHCKPMGCMCESRSGSHSVLSNIGAPGERWQLLNLVQFQSDARARRLGSAARFIYQQNLT